MQTFLPYPNFSESAESLDRQRLGKQRVEALTILRVLRGSVSGWRNHPAVRMWRGHEASLMLYARMMCMEWKSRGYDDNVLQMLYEERVLFGIPLENVLEPMDTPEWLGDEAFHRSHRSNLIRKLPEFYGHKWPGVPEDLPYVWPV